MNAAPIRDDEREALDAYSSLVSHVAEHVGPAVKISGFPAGSLPPIRAADQMAGARGSPRAAA